MESAPLGPRAPEAKAWGRTGTTRSVRWAAFLLAGSAVLALRHLLSRQPARSPEREADHPGVQIQAPIRGRFYHALHNGVPLVRVGDRLAIGGLMGILDDGAGVRHEICTAVAGRVVRIVPANGQHVAVGAPLLLIEPRA